MPAKKALEALSISQTYADPGSALLDGLTKHAVHLTGDASRDLDAVIIDTSDPKAVLVAGMWHGVPRLAATLEVSGASGEITLMASKGTTSVFNVQFGTRGANIGNEVLIAATFHVAIFYLRAAGLSELTNRPYTASLQLKYELMGFQNGTVLPLDDAPALEKAFTYIEGAYQKRGLSLSRSPLPL